MDILLILTLTGACGFLFSKQKGKNAFYDKDFWAILIVAFVITMMSGQMWNHIRNPPYAYQNPRTGEFMYIYNNSRYQLIAETFIVIIMYALIFAGFVILNKTSKQLRNIESKKKYGLPGFVLVLAFFSLLLSVFKSKNHGYPFRLLFG